MMIELSYGFWTNSLGLITDSFHMLFDCMGLLIGLIASYISKLPSNKYYPQGYAKVETLSGFFNGLLLIFTAYNVF
jgi:solute carrier family 30 (zinc transporter), member 5/7